MEKSTNGLSKLFSNTNPLNGLFLSVATFVNAGYQYFQVTSIFQVRPLPDGDNEFMIW